MIYDDAGSFVVEIPANQLGLDVQQDCVPLWCQYSICFTLFRYEIKLGNSSYSILLSWCKKSWWVKVETKKLQSNVVQKSSKTISGSNGWPFNHAWQTPNKAIYVSFGSSWISAIRKKRVWKKDNDWQANPGYFEMNKDSLKWLKTLRHKRKYSVFEFGVHRLDCIS